MQPKHTYPPKRTNLLMELEVHIKGCVRCQECPYAPCAEGKRLVVEVIESAKEIHQSRTMHYTIMQPTGR